MPGIFSAATAQGRAISDLFVLELVLSALLLLFILGLITAILVRFRGRPGEPDPPQAGGHRRLEIAWTAAPLAVLAVLFGFTFQAMQRASAADQTALLLRVIGHQWWWEFQYPDLGVTAANEVHAPVDRPLTLEIESADVLHSFWAPRFGAMRDAIPGKINRLPLRIEQAGSYDGACTQFCGLQHAWMRNRIIVDPPDQFDAWVRSQQQPAASPSGGAAAMGRDIFLTATCVNCHTVAGTPAAGRAGPDLTHFGSRSTIGGGVLPNTLEDVQRWVRDAGAIKPGVLMPSFQTLSDEDLGALATYLKSLR